MNDFTALENPNPADTDSAGVIHKSTHKHRMGRQQIVQAVRRPNIQFLIGGDSAAHFLDITKRPDNRLAVNNVRYLFKTKRIVFNGKRRVDGAYAIFPPQLRRKAFRRERANRGKLRETFAYGRDQP